MFIANTPGACVCPWQVLLSLSLPVYMDMYMYMYMYMCRADPGPVIVVVPLGLSGFTGAGFPVQPSQSALEEAFTYEKTIKIA